MVKRVLDKVIRQQMDVNEIQFGFMAIFGTTNSIYVLRQSQEKKLTKKLLHFAYIDLEKAFDWVSKNVAWLGLKGNRCGRLAGLYCTAKDRNHWIRVRVNETLSEY